jgi:hypothetical protein
MSQTLLPLAGFEVTFNGRFWVTAEETIGNCLVDGPKNDGFYGGNHSSS